MTTTSLLADLKSRGVVLTQVDGDIQIQSPKGELTDDDIQVIRDHKPELIDLLTVPSRWGEYHDAIADAFGNPSTREAIGPLWMTDPDGWPGSRPKAAKPTPGICPRCGSDQFKDVPIHGGKSIRRDCAKCSKFLAFPRWSPKEDRDQ
jgi:hypothetical protein